MPINRVDLEAIEKLLRLAERPGTPAEGESALRRAEAIAAKSGINLDDVRADMKRQEQARTRWSDFTQRTPSKNPPKNPDFDSWNDAYPGFHGYARGSGKSHWTPPPKPPEEVYFESMTKIAFDMNYFYTDSSFHTFNSDGTTYHRWEYRKNPLFYVLIPNAMKGFDPYTKQTVYTKVANPVWFFYHKDRDTPIASGPDINALRSILQWFDYAHEDAAAKEAKAERLRPRFAPASFLQDRFDEVLKRHGYTCEPPQGPDQINRQYESPDRTSSIETTIDTWIAFTRIGNRTKSDVKDIKKIRCTAELEAFLIKRAKEKEVKFHSNPDMDMILRMLHNNGFVEDSLRVKKDVRKHGIKGKNSLPTGNRVFRHKGTNLWIEVGRSGVDQPGATGRITKDEKIWWMLKSLSNPPLFRVITGYGYTEFQTQIDRMMFTGGLDAFQAGPEAMARLVKEYNFKPLDESTIFVKYRSPGFVWYTIGEKMCNVKCAYYVGYHKVTGEYRMVLHSLKEDTVMESGLDVLALRKKLHNLEFEPGQLHEEDIVEYLRQMQSICKGYGFDGTYWEEKIRFTSADKLTAVSIDRKTAAYRVSYYNFDKCDHDVVSEGNNPNDLYVALKAHMEEKRPSAMTREVIFVAEEFGFMSGKWK